MSNQIDDLSKKYITYLVNIRQIELCKEQFMKEYWDLCTEYVFFHFTYFKGQPNQNMDAILNNATGSAYRMDIVEPNKFRQGSITMLRKVNDI